MKLSNDVTEIEVTKWVKTCQDSIILASCLHNMYSAWIYVLFTSLYACTVPGFNYTLRYVYSARIQIFILCCSVYTARVQSYCVVLLTCARILFLTTTMHEPGSCNISTCCLECITQQSPCIYDVVPHR